MSDYEISIQGVTSDILKDGKRMSSPEIVRALMDYEQLQARCAELEDKLNTAQNISENWKIACRWNDEEIERLQSDKAQQQELIENQTKSLLEMDTSKERLANDLSVMEGDRDSWRRVAERLEREKLDAVLATGKQQERLAELKSALSSCLKWLGWWSQSYPESPGPGDKQHIDEWKALLSELPTPPTSGGE